MRYVPFSLIAVRFLLALLFLAFGLMHRSIAVPGIVFTFILVIAVLSDIFDGVIARRVGVADERLRRMDSQTDILFWVSAFIAAWLIHPGIVMAHGFEISLLIGFEIVLYLVSWARFGKGSSTHAYSAKAYGLGLLVGMIVLPAWAHDVPTVYHALGLRRACLGLTKGEPVAGSGRGG
jgi:CDP-diacylglycerol--glycerol-3-phosphate 3-phosphatidyltransferase